MVNTESKKGLDEQGDVPVETNDGAEINETKDGNNSDGSSVSEKDEILKSKDIEIAQLKEQVLRGRADFDNFRKRCLKNDELNRKLAVKEFALDMITINDNLIRASDAALVIEEGANIDQAHRAYVDGVYLISKNIEQALNKHGVEEIEALNTPFNPIFHEAIEYDTSNEVEDDIVTKVYQKGFKIDSMVIRNARVKVTKAARKNDETLSDQNVSETSTNSI
jgi:molecular chaperone GrpE